MTPEPRYHLHQLVCLEQMRKLAGRVFFDGRVDNSHRVDHMLILEMSDEYVYVIENGFITLISVWSSSVAPLVEQCKRSYALSRVRYGAPDHSRGLPGVTNW